MSMICWLLRLSPAQLFALRADPSLASDLAETTQETAAQASLSNSLARLPPEQRAAIEAQYRFSIGNMPGAMEEQARMAQAQALLAPLGPFEPPLSLEKSWHILHYLFTGHVGDAAAPGNELLSGAPLGRDVGYGPARLQGENETWEFARFLRTQDVAHLLARLNYREMLAAGVYSMPFGHGSDAEFEAELREEAGNYFPLLRKYVSEAAELGQGLLIWLS